MRSATDDRVISRACAVPPSTGDSEGEPYPHRSTRRPIRTYLRNAKRGSTRLTYLSLWW